MKRSRGFLAAVGVTALALAAPAPAAVIRVPGDFSTVTNAVVAAVDGDVIRIAGNGGATYPLQDLNIDKSITLQGGWRIDFQTQAPDIYVSVLRDTTGLFQRPVIRVVGAVDVVFEGVQIYGGRFGIVADGGANITIRDTTIQGQRHTVASPGVDANIGTGVHMVGGTLLMENSHVHNVRSTFPGSALGLVNLTSARIVDSLIEDTLATTIFGDASGGAIFARDLVLLELTGTRFVNCATVQRGGAAYLLRTALLATDTEFLDGLASTSGGALYLEGCPSAEIRDCTFERNRSTLGSGVYAIDSSALSISGSRFANQQGFRDGAALSLVRTDFSVDQCAFEHNHAATFPTVVAERGGSAFVTDSNGTVTATTFTDEKAESKGGAWAQAGGTVSFTDCIFANCDAGLFGGSVQIELGGRIDMTRCLIAGSGARFGGAVSASFTGDINLEHCTIADGEGRSAGAAVYLDTGSSVRVANSIVCCAKRGDQMFCGAGTLIVVNSDIWNDDAVNARGEYGGLCPDLTGQFSNLSENPLLCPGDPEYRIASGSPGENAASDGSDMGWQSVGCSVPNPLGVEPTSWGRIKALYRGE